MAITEQSRHRVHQYFEEIMGQERADMVMEFLPTHDWADLATKHDLEDLRLATKQDLENQNLVMKAEFAAVRQEMAVLRAELHRDMRTLALALVGTNITLVGLAVAFLKLT